MKKAGCHSGFQFFKMERASAIASADSDETIQTQLLLYNPCTFVLTHKKNKAISEIFINYLLISLGNIQVLNVYTLTLKIVTKGDTNPLNYKALR